MEGTRKIIGLAVLIVCLAAGLLFAMIRFNAPEKSESLFVPKYPYISLTPEARLEPKFSFEVNLHKPVEFSWILQNDSGKNFAQGYVRATDNTSTVQGERQGLSKDENGMIFIYQASSTIPVIKMPVVLIGTSTQT